MKQQKEWNWHKSDRIGGDKFYSKQKGRISANIEVDYGSKNTNSIVRVNIYRKTPFGSYGQKHILEKSYAFGNKKQADLKVNQLKKRVDKYIKCTKGSKKSCPISFREDI